MTVEKLLLAKAEVTYDTDPTPDSSNAIETIGDAFSRYEGDRVQRDVDRNTLGGKAQINTNPYVMGSFGVAMQGSGTAGDAPLYDPLLQACGFDATEAVGVSWTYQLPADSADLIAAESVTMWDYRPQVSMIQKVTGVRGSVALSMGRGALPRFNFSNMIGTYNRPISGAGLTGIDWSGWKDELPFTKDNVPTLTLDSVAACVESLDIDFGLQVGRRNLPNCQQTILSGYEVSGQMTIVAPAIATKNWFEKAESHNGISDLALSVVYGTVAGKILTIASTKANILNIVEGESAEGDLTFQFDLTFTDRPTLVFT